MVFSLTIVAVFSSLLMNTAAAAYDSANAEATETTNAYDASGAEETDCVDLPTPSCYNVDVYSDASYCTKDVKAETACSAVQNADAVCPMAGATSLSGSCNSIFNSYVGVDKCTLPENTICRELPDGEWGCAFATSNFSNDVLNGGLMINGNTMNNDDDDKSNATKTSVGLVTAMVILAMIV